MKGRFFYLAFFFFLAFSLWAKEAKKLPFQAGEVLYYNIYYKGIKIGTSTLKFLGERKLGRKKAYCVTFYTNTPYFKDLETIYADENTFLPLKVKRKITRLAMPKMYIEETYDQRKKKVVIRKKGLIFSHRLVVEKEAPIDNPILSVYNYRLLDSPEAGKEMVLNFPRRKFTVKYEGVKEVSLRRQVRKVRVFKGYPAGFEVWVQEGKNMIPLKITNPSLFGYALVFNRQNYEDK